MTVALRVALAQYNFWVGDVEGNVDKIITGIQAARDEEQADLVVFPELCVLGYPPDDLLLRAGLPELITQALARIVAASKGIVVVVGYPEYTEQGIYNAAAVIRDGRQVANYRKQRRPNYGVFDEKRHFLRGYEPCVFQLRDMNIGVTICEDVWSKPAVMLSRSAGAQLIVNLNASPFQLDKAELREQVLKQRADENALPICYVNCVGGQDEVVFDGGSMVCDGQGEIVLRGQSFAEELLIADFGAGAKPLISEQPESLRSEEALTYGALVQGIRDYTDRNGFPGVLVGLSGGIDSAMTVALAVDALGAERVWAVSMPSRYTAGMSVDDAQAQAEALGVRCDVIPIEGLHKNYLETLNPYFAGKEPDLTEENLQARIRGVLLMGLSNKFGHLVLATGNKSEMAVGYATLYGDMCGGFAPLKDVYKTLVYRMARWRNAQSEVEAIPSRVIERPPSAELRPDQQDSDSLPPYDVLDEIIFQYVERQQSISNLVDSGFDREIVEKVAGLIRRSEYKRRQAPPGPKITGKAFGRDRRYPITAVYGDI